MTKDLHPSLLEHYIQTNTLAAIASWGLLTVAWGLLSVGIVVKIPLARLTLFGAAVGCCAVAKPMRRIAIATERTRSDIRDISTQSFQNWLHDHMKPESATVELYPEPQQAESETYEFDAILEEAVGIALLGNSGSGKSSVAKYIIGLMGQTQILVLDPHDDGETWDGLPVLSDYDDIVQQLDLLLTELDSRRTRRKQKQKLEPVVIICDEWPSVRSYCEQKGLDVADRFLLRFGSESRKFEMLCLFCSQSGNTKALGLEGRGDFLENYLLIRLHRVALKYAKNLSDRTVLQRLKQVGFPCLVGDEVSIHPTHGHYPKFAKQLPPRQLKPLRSLPLTIDLATRVSYQPLTPEPLTPSAPPEATPPAQPGSSPSSEPSQPLPPVLPGADPRTYLERLWELEFGSPDSTPEPADATPDSPAPGEGDPRSAPGSDFPEVDDVDDVTLRSLILDFRSMGITGQDAFIEALWGVTKGGSPKYRRARERYQAICKRYGL